MCSPTFPWGDNGPQSPARLPLPIEVLIYRQKRFLSKRSLLMGCIDIRQGIFSTLLTTLWQSMQSCTDESHSIKIYRRDHRRFGGVAPPTPLTSSYTLVLTLQELFAFSSSSLRASSYMIATTASCVTCISYFFPTEPFRKYVRSRRGGGDAQKSAGKVQERGGALRRTCVRSEFLNGN